MPELVVFLSALVSVILFAVFAFRVFPDACVFCLWRYIVYAAAGDAVSTVFLRDFAGYGWADEINFAVNKFGNIYGNGAVLAVNHIILVLVIFILAYVCGKFQISRFIFTVLVFILGINMWAVTGWNIAKTIVF